MTVNLAYWRSWSTDRSETCNKFDPSSIDETSYTHVAYSFASISADGHLEPWVGSWDEVEKYKEFNKIKERNPNVKTIIAVTEGIFYGPGMNPVTFNEVSESQASRIAFAQSVISFLNLYEFDGVDIDWDNPLDEDQGGGPQNYVRYVLLVKEIRAAINDSGKDFTLTIALPPTADRLFDFDVVSLSEYVDWFNLMSFDYHTPKDKPKTVGPHSDLKLIDTVVYLLIKEGIPSTKIVLGMAAYGRTYTLADDRCKELGCPFRSPGLGGCGNTPGFLPFNEISAYIETGAYDELHLDVSSSSMVAVVDEDQMISFDDESTFAIKEDYAEMMCLRGTMIWSVDMLKATTPLPMGRSITTPRHSKTPQTRSLMGDIPPGQFYCGSDRNHAEETCEMSCKAGDNSACPYGQSCFAVPKCGSQVVSESTSSTTTLIQSKSFGFTEQVLQGCNLCDASHVHSSATVEYEGSIVSCTDLDLMLNAASVPGESDQCHEIHSKYSANCCKKALESPCDVCESKTNLVLLKENPVLYAGNSTLCGDVSNSLQVSREQTSFTCTLAKTSLSNICCAKPCHLCDDGDLKNDGFFERDGSQVSCADFEAELFRSNFIHGGEECSALTSDYSKFCCLEAPESRVTSPTPLCNLCQREAIHHELRAETMVQYKGATLSCTDISNILSIDEKEGSEMCDITQSMLFDGCCYEKCSLCGDRSLKWDATVEYNDQILSCDEFSSMFSMSLVHEDSDQCNTIQSTYSNKCCFAPPKTPCNLCKRGSSTFDIIPDVFVKHRTSSATCFNIYNTLLEREEEGSGSCKDSQSTLFESCCNSISKTDIAGSYSNDNSYQGWLATYISPKSAGASHHSRLSFWSFMFLLACWNFIYLIS